tara:strand:- start:94982 stop:95620 length:639 start_codon:yes stop_codon:yes gene_type:complete
MNNAVSAREANSIRIREALMTACADLLARHPIDAITINKIVDTAGVAKGSFYNHFTDKESLAGAVAAAIRSDVEADVSISNQGVGDPARKIARGICNHIQLAVSDSKRAMILFRGYEGATSDTHPLNQSAKQHITEGIACGRLAPRCENAGFILLYGTVVSTSLRIMEQQLSVADARNLCVEVLTLVLCGFGLQEEEARQIMLEAASEIING